MGGASRKTQRLYPALETINAHDELKDAGQDRSGEQVLQTVLGHEGDRHSTVAAEIMAGRPPVKLMTTAISNISLFRFTGGLLIAAAPDRGNEWQVFPTTAHRAEAKSVEIHLG